MEKKEDFEGDEEISFDFGKVKKLFGQGKKELSDEEKPVAKKPEKEKTKVHKAEDKKSEEDFSEEKEEVSLDLSKIKNIFKRDKKQASHEKEPEEELHFDAKKVKGFFSKKQHIIIPLVLILIAVFLSVYVRIQPAYLPATDDWARGTVEDYFKSQIRTEIEQQYPNLPAQNQDILIEREFKTFSEENKDLIEQQVKQTSAYFKSQMQDDSGQTYLIGLDPYFWYRHAENILKNGHPGDELRDGLPYDNHMLAPIGRFVPEDMFHAYFEAYLFKFLHFFNPDLTLIKVAFYVPILLMALAVIPTFFIAKKIGGNIGGFVAAVIVAVHPAILSRTIGGFADTDPYTILFPVLITWLFLIAFETKDIKKTIIFTSLSGLFVGLFAFSWGGWWYIFDFILATTIIYLIAYTIIHREELKGGTKFLKQPSVKNTFLIILIFILSAGIFTSLFVDFNYFKNATLAPIGFVNLKQVGVTTVWPNVYTTVAEQNPASFDTIISQIGFGGKTSGKFLWIVAVIGIIFVMFRKDVHGKRDLKYAILLGFWIIATVYASTKGVRYTQLIVPAFSICVGVALGLAYKFMAQWTSKELKINKTIVSILLLFLIIVLFLAGPVKAGIINGRNSVSDMNDSWYNSLDKINKNSKDNAIINSWWDFGHWFKEIGNRAVTFDGTSQNSPQAYWIGKALLTENEDVTVGILRMLDCGANTAFDELDKVINDSVRSIDILNVIIVSDKETAKKILKREGLTDEQIEFVIKNTHCDPPEDFFITSDDMIQKSGVWAHFGSWDFEKAMIYNTLLKPEYTDDVEKSVEFMEKRFNYSEETAREVFDKVETFEKGGKDVNDWIAPWPGYASGINNCRKSNETFVCTLPQGGQAIVDPKTMEVDIPTATGIMHPNAVAYVTKDGFFKKEFNNTIGFGMVLIPSGDSYKNILTSPELTGSMFTRMFFLKGQGLQHFKPFSYERSPIGGGEIYVWKVDWRGKEKNYVSEFFPGDKTNASVTDTNITG